ncbi:flagellar hook-basal body protein [Legionella worsleiensis]|uniref:Flagellar basal body rod protein FlgG n=1 Tax=Legionella worsleiensis TaxID=45076 RepID=A0A0W1A6C6_9GAMM|nr:flagellar hook-basal body complex protein [Legionella worsleiensis]KTD76768.1 flagellar basal body rod protein FlgG [Legionella worsleiensis]STY30586.1 flagellar basal-body rod protein FlgG [Legionella worsleiensis]
MSDALSIAASGLKSEEFYIDKIANDVANLNTANYKATKITFEDVLYQNIQSEQSLFNNHSAIKLGLGTAVYKSGKDFTTGPLKSTNNWNDVAIDGVGFFQIMNKDGTIAYTRNSTLSIDSDRYLTTHDGLRLADNIQIPDDFTKITIQANGDVEAILSDEQEPQLLGTIQLAKFINPETLNPIGAGIYLPSDESGDPLTDNPGSSGLGALVQHQIEGSNVDMVDSLMQLTMAQRIYQLNAKAVQIADELEKLTNEIRD